MLSIACAASLLIGRLNQGWWHHDDGSFAHSAQRVLAGELPNRDFADLYTGLLTFMNAAVFALIGEDMYNLRLPLFALFLAFVGCFFAISRRLVSPGWAFVATLFAIGWSLPVYPAPMPSWYILFLSTIGLYAVVKFFETDRRRWLFLAGVCGGISMAIKIVGVWYMTAVLLTLLVLPLLDDSEPRSYHRRSRIYAATLMFSALFALALAIAVFSGRFVASEVVSLLVPVAVLCGAIAVLGWRAWGSPSRAPDGAAAGDVAALLAGMGMPLALFVTPYVLSGSLGELLRAVLITPRSRYEFSSYSGPDPVTLLRALPVVALFIARSFVRDKARLFIDVAAGTIMIFAASTASTQPGYSILWGTTRALAPFVIVLGAIAILRRGQGPVGVQPRVVLLIVLVAGFSTLIQFPYAAPLYFCYIAPLVLLAAIAGLRRVGWAKGLLPGVVLVALVVFGIRQLDNQSIWSLGVEYKADPQVAILDSHPASFRFHPETSAEYDRVLALVAQHRGRATTIFAGPDAPEIYFLTRSRNPTPAILDFLDGSGSTRGSRLIRLLESEEISVVVLNHIPQQSPKLAQSTIERIRSTYTRGEQIGGFEVRWMASET